MPYILILHASVGIGRPRAALDIAEAILRDMRGGMPT